MDRDQAELIHQQLRAITKQLERIAEVNKMNLWFMMETQANPRQKKIISDVLAKL